jgi:multidrug efflux pump subunit AcrA (membrane-fusion protein)
MEEHRENQENQNESNWEFEPAGINRWLVIGAVALLIVAGVAFGYGYRQQIAVGHLTAQQSVANGTIDQLQGQLNTVNSKLNDMVAAQQAAAQAAEQAAAQKKSAAKRGAPVDKRYKQLQAQLEDQEKQLKETQDLVAKNRTDLETSLGSTKDELNGSIAKTHDELVVLQKRGERNYFEFDLNKSKQFQRFGPITLSLRRTDAKHMNYDLTMVVDDNQLSKKRVNLYEPIWIHMESAGQPVQVVVNKIGKNFVHGYISAPKYKESDLAASASAATLTPASAKTPVDPNRPNQQPEQQQEQQPPQTQQPQPPQPDPPRPQPEL